MSPKLYWHIVIHGILILLIFNSFGYWSLALAVMFAHGLIDILKIYFQTERNRAKWFLIDQLLHLFSLSVIFYNYFDSEVHLEEISLTPQIWLYSTAFIVTTFVAGVFIQVLMSNWSRVIIQIQKDSLPLAGKYIGMLERALVFLFIVNDRWEAIGFLLAAKSVFRFGELKKSKDVKLTEYILIGTLLSFGIAIVIGLVTVELYEHIE